jgi:hypothetical protein
MEEEGFLGRGRSKPDDAGGSERESANHLSSVTRRGFIAGAASTVAVAGSATAQPGLVEFSIQESDSEIAVVFRNELCAAPLTFLIVKDYWSKYSPGANGSPQFRVTDVASPAMPDNSNRRTATVQIRDATFAGTGKFDARFVFQLLDQNCQVALTTVGWPRAGAATVFPAVDFVDFMSDVRSLRVELSKMDISLLIKQLFGGHVGYAGDGQKPKPKEAVKHELALRPDLSWRLSGLFSIPAGLGTGSTNVFEFDRLGFSPSQPNVSAFSPSDASASAFSQEILDLAFPDLVSRTNAANATPGKDSPPSGSVTSPSDPFKNLPKGMVGFSDGPLGGATSVDLGKLGGILVNANSTSPVTAAFLQLGDPAKTASALAGDFEVWVRQKDLTEGPFLTSRATVARYVSGGLSGFARMPIAARPMTVSTAHGRFCIEAADAVVPAPGADQVRPGVVLQTNEKGDVTSLEIDALIRQAFVPFPASSADEHTLPFFSRLDFMGGDCKFVLEPLAAQTPLFSSGSIIRLCATGLPDAKGAPIRLGLDQAILRAVRPDDLLSLKWRFSGLALLSGGGRSSVVPLRGGPCGVHLVSAVNEVSRRHNEVIGNRFLPGASVDDRPIMVVEFPPQHVAERAYFRQIDDGADPPDVALSDQAVDGLCWSFDVLNAYRAGGKATLEDRLAARRMVQDAKICAERDAQAAQNKDSTAKPGDASKVQVPRLTFEDFGKQFGLDAQFAPSASRWPDDQKIYIGSEWLDPDVRRFARKLAAKMARDMAMKASPLNNEGATAASSRLMDEEVREKLPAVDLTDPDFKNWAASYDRWGERLFGGLPPYCGPDSVQALVETGQINNARLAMLVAKIEQDIGGPEDFSQTEATEARLSGPTRLAFRINCDDFEGSGGSFPFTLADLTNWSRFDLSVVRRAEKLLDFDSSGRLPPHWSRKEILDPTALLQHQGIQPARSWLAGPNAARVSVTQRLAEVYASANTRPQPLETAIELPFRLILSAAQDARWRTPALMPQPGSPFPLWQASMEEDTARASLRAIWSEDFQPDVLRDGTQPTPHGVWAPWDAPVAQDDGGPAHSNARFRAVMDAGDRHELVTLSSVYGLPVVGRRDQQGHLKSDGDQIEPPPGFRLKGLPDDSDAIYSPRALSVNELALSALGGSISLDTHFQPPAGVTLLGKTDPLFVLDIERWRHTAVLGRDISVEIVYKGFLFPLGNRVSFVKLTERRFMRHPSGGPVAYLIQRMFLRVGNPKKTFPALGQANVGRCFPPQIINILTRRTPDIVDPTDRPSIKIDSVIKDAPYRYHEYAKGAVTFSKDGGITPLAGLVFWPRVSSSDSGNVRFEVQIDDTAGSVSMPMLFVDNVAAHTPETMAAVCEYYNQAMLLTKRTVYHGGTPRRYAIENRDGDSTFETLSWELKAEGGGGQTGFLGPDHNSKFDMPSPLEGADQPPFYPYLDNCVIRLNQVGKFTGGAAPVTTAEYFPKYLQYGFSDPNYPNTSEVFLQIKAKLGQDLPPLAFGSSGDRAAGVGRPENRIVALSRNNGPIGGINPLRSPADSVAQKADKSKLASSSSPPPASPPPKDGTPAPAYYDNFDPSKFDPSSFFGKFGKLLGVIDLGEVIKAVAGLTGMPELSETIDYASAQGWDIVRQTILQPLNGVLDTLDKTWASMNVGVGGNVQQQLQNAFPDVATTEKALRAAVQSALAATAPPIDQQAQLLGVIYEKARAFIQALQRMAADPLGPIAVSLQKQVQSLTGSAADFLGLNKITAVVQAHIDQIASILTTPVPDVFDAMFLFQSIVDKPEYKDEFKKLASDKIQELKSDAAKILEGVTVRVSIDDAFRNALIQKIEVAAQVREDLTGDLAQFKKAVADSSAFRGALYESLGPLLQQIAQAANTLQLVVGTRIAVGTWADAAPELFDALTSLAQSSLRLLDLPRIVSCETAVSILVNLLAAIRHGEVTTQSFLQKLSQFFGASPPKTLAEQLKAAFANLPAGLTWADGLRNAITTPLGQIIALLSDPTKLPKEYSRKEAGQIASNCSRDIEALKPLVTELRDQIEIRKTLLQNDISIAGSIAAALANFPSTIDRDAGSRAAIAALSIARILVGLPLTPESGELKEAIASLGSLPHDPSDPQFPPDGKALSDIAGKIEDEIQQITDAGSVEELVAKVNQASGILQGGLGPLLAFAKAENALMSQGAKLESAALDLAGNLIDAALTLLKQFADTLAPVCAALAKNVQGVTDGLGAIDPTVGQIVAPMVGAVSLALGQLQSALADERSALTTLSDKIGKTGKTNPSSDDIIEIRGDVKSVSDGLSNIATAAKGVASAVTTITQALLKGQIAKLIDINAPRKEIESLIRDLIPHKATLAYNLDTQLSPLGDFFIPDADRGARRLTISTTAVVDLLSPDQTPQTTVQGILDPINIHLFGSSFDVVMLKFKRATFGLSPGSSFKFNIDIEDVQLGEMVAFLQALQSYLTPSDGNGFYLRPASGVPGIEVGYGLNLGTISLGPVSFINVSLNAGCRLPFDSGNALFTISLSRPDSPFLISVGIYGGGGYLALIANGSTIVGFEASFEFGGVAAFSFGPLSGLGMLTTGIFVRNLYGKTSIDGFFFCGGSARIACFGISASLMVSISMQPGGAMAGQAVFTFSFSIGFAHIDFHITVFKTQPALGGSASAEPLEAPRTRFAALASDLPDAVAPTRAAGSERFHSTTMSSNRDWREYRKYFATDIQPRKKKAT